MPHYNWRNLYVASEDDRSPFYGREYSEFEFTHSIYDHFIHPQWDSIGSPTLFIKILFVNYDEGSCIIELMGEWNDTLHNDIMHLKRELIDNMLMHGIRKFVLIGENVLNFHADGDDYYEEWREEVAEDNGWIVLLNFRDHVVNEMVDEGLQRSVIIDEVYNQVNWRTFPPTVVCSNLSDKIESKVLQK